MTQRLTTLTVKPGGWHGPMPVVGDWIGAAAGKNIYQIQHVRLRLHDGTLKLKGRPWPRGTEPPDAPGRRFTMTSDNGRIVTRVVPAEGAA